MHLVFDCRQHIKMYIQAHLCTFLYIIKITVRRVIDFSMIDSSSHRNQKMTESTVRSDGELVVWEDFKRSDILMKWFFLLLFDIFTFLSWRVRWWHRFDVINIHRKGSRPSPLSPLSPLLTGKNNNKPAAFSFEVTSSRITTHVPPPPGNDRFPTIPSWWLQHPHLPQRQRGYRPWYRQYRRYRQQWHKHAITLYHKGAV